MRPLLIIASLLFFSFNSHSQTATEDILNSLRFQTESWNEGNIEKFMETYWKNDSLMFVGKNGITYGYENTLRNYKKGYPSKEKMGKLSFDILQVRPLSSDYYFVVGKWTIDRTDGTIGGHYTLLFRKINGKWLIVSDHSS